jgi:hypothetical protein
MAMVKVKIISRPAGEAPEWVRDAWIGIQFEAKRDDLNAPGFIRMGVLGGKADNENGGGYVVSGPAAMEALRKHNPKAAEWWKMNSPIAFFGTLVFGAKFCEVVE